MSIAAEINSEEAKKSYEGIESFCLAMAKDPTGYVSNIPWQTVIGLLVPPSIKTALYQVLGERDIREVLGRFGADPTGTALRLPFWLTTAFIPKKTRKKLAALIDPKSWLMLAPVFFGKRYGLVSRQGQLMPKAIIGWAVDKLVTGTGEGLGKVFDFIPGVGRPLGDIFRRRWGKSRDKNENLVTNTVGILLDLAQVAVGLLARGSLALLDRVPAFRAARTWLTTRGARAYAALESRIPVIRYFRFTGATLRSLVAAVPHGLATGGLTYLATGGNWPATLSLGSADLLWQGTRTLARGLPELRAWSGLQLSRAAFSLPVNPLAKFAAWQTTSEWAYLPIKGPLASLVVTNVLLPAFGINLPIWAKGLIAIGAGGAEYFLQTSVRFFIERLIAPTSWLGRFVSGAGRFAGNSLPGVLLGGFIGVSLHLPWWQVGLTSLGGGAIWGLLAKLLPKIFGASPWALIGGIIGPILANYWGFTSIAQQFMASLLGSVIMTAVGNYLIVPLINLAFPGLITGLAGMFGGMGALAAGATLAAVGAVAVLAVVTVIIVSSAFFKEAQKLTAPEQSECFAPTKNVVICSPTDFDGQNCKNPKSKAVGGDYLIYAIKLNPVLPGIQKISLTDRVNPRLGRNKNLKLLESFNLIHSPPGFQLKTKTAFETFDFQLTFVWEAPTISPADDILTYTLQLDSDFQKGTITNEAIVDGQAKKTVYVAQTERQTEYEKLQEAYKKCFLSIPACNELNDLRIKIEEFQATNFIQSEDAQAPSETIGETKPVEVRANCIAKRTTVINTNIQEAIDLLRKALSNCGTSFVTKNNLEAIRSCLGSDPTAKIIMDQLEKSVISSLGYNEPLRGKLQCVGFIYALEAATGGSIQNYPADAQDHWRDISGYTKISSSNYENIQVGDIMIWSNPHKGHLAIVVEVNRVGSEVKSIKTLQADGTTGEIKYENLAVTSDGFGDKRTKYYGNLLGWQRRKN